MIEEICNCCGKPFSYRKAYYNRREFPYTCTPCVRGYCNRPNPNEKHLMTRYKHGHSLEGKKTKVFRLYSTMHERCYNKNTKSYKYYGGKGLTVCPRWHDFTTFYNDIKKMGYEEGDTLLRKDKKGRYEPSNIVVHKGKVTGSLHYYCGEYLTLNQLFEKATNGISRIGLKKRLKVNPSAEKAIHTPLKRKPKLST